MTTTYKTSNNCLLFFSAKNFCDAVNTIFQFRFVETNLCRFILEYRPVNELFWQRKPISICLTENHIEVNPLGNYRLGKNDNNVEEDVHLLKMYYILHELLVEALNNPDLILPEHKVTVSAITIFSPYHFKKSEFQSWQQVPGQTTLRISSAEYKINKPLIFYLSFNNWKGAGWPSG